MVFVMPIISSWRRFSRRGSRTNTELIVILEDLEGTGTESIEIGGSLRCIVELIGSDLALILVEAHKPLDLILLKHSLPLLVSIVVSLLDFIRHGYPILWDSQAESHSGLEVRLIEGGEDSEAVEGLELRVQVLLLVFLVDERGETQSFVFIRGEVSKSDLVPAELDQLGLYSDLLMLKGLSTLLFMPVDSHLIDCHSP